MGQRPSNIKGKDNVSEVSCSGSNDQKKFTKQEKLLLAPDIQRKGVCLRFHRTHGENIALSPSKEQAIRSGSFCHGIVFR